MKEVMLIIHELGLVITIGSSLFFLIIKNSLKLAFDQDAVAFQKISSKFRKSTYLGLLIMIISGGYLMTPYWAHFAQMPMIHIKMTIVIIWLLTLAVLGMTTKSVKQKSHEKYFSRLVLIHILSVLYGILVVIIATISFH